MMPSIDPALAPLEPGPCIGLRNGAMVMQVAPAAGGRIATLQFHEQPWLVGPHAGMPGAISWGCYPMLPWAGRVRQGRFDFQGRTYTLPINLGPHAIHGVGLDRPWQILEQSSSHLLLELKLDDDARWPFAGTARHRIQLHEQSVRLELEFQAGALPMPRPVLGWHPWFCKVPRLDFRPRAFYPRDGQGIATLPLQAPPGPQDDCYINERAVTLVRGSQALQLRAGCDHWVYFDEQPHATCVEPQTGPPDAFNLSDAVLQAGESMATWFEMGFSQVDQR